MLYCELARRNALHSCVARPNGAALHAMPLCTERAAAPDAARKSAEAQGGDAER
jgi:hypothetical protein